MFDKKKKSGIFLEHILVVFQFFFQGYFKKLII